MKKKFSLNWGNSILLFFIVFLSLAIYFIIFSLRHHNDLVVRDYYEQGANYSVQMNIDARSIPFADSVKVTTNEDVVRIVLSPYIMKGAKEVDVYFYRPMDKREDVKELFVMPKVISLNKERFARGRYELTVSWSMRGEEYQVKKTVSIKK